MAEYGASERIDGSVATGIVVAYWIKMAIVAYLIAHNEFGFRLPTLPFDIAFVLERLSANAGL